MADIYDGAVWQSFMHSNDNELLASRYGIGLAINVDWFQPYSHVPYSVGVIYICVLNFPRRIRYLSENTFVIGIIPGPQEPKLHINSFLEPLVKDLLKLWKGIQMETPEGEQLVHAVLLCATSDVPASRKLGGFLGHTALKGCSHCLKSFPTANFGESNDYSGFDRSTWEKRSADNHRQNGMSWKHAITLSQRHEIERKYGVRYTELLRLSYFDTSRFTVVDPMHNMLLGTAKQITHIWKCCGLLSESNFDLIQSSVDKFVVPADVGRIPHKISSKFSSFTADQWKNWTLIYSCTILKPLIPDVHYKCWCTFADACQLMCSRAISQNGISKLDSLLLSFCQTFEELYGASSCTPNLHLHCHLKECFLDYGPASAFWVFAYERLNGILGSVLTNHRNIETQLMQKFFSKQQVLQRHANSNCEIQSLFQPYLHSKGSLKHDKLPELPLVSNLSLSNVVDFSEVCKLLPPVKEGCLDSDEHTCIESTLKACFSSAYKRTLLLYKYSRAIRYGGEIHGSLNSIHSSSSLLQISCNGDIKPGFTMKYLKITVIVAPPNSEDKTIDVYLGAVTWLKEHPEKNWFNYPVEVWRKFHTCGHSYAYITVSNIICRRAHTTEVVEFRRGYKEEVTIIVPLNNHFGLC